MDAIIIEAEVGQDHRLVDEFPPEVPVGRVKLMIQPLEKPTAVAKTPLTREAARAKMLAAGILSTAHRAPEGATELTPEERERVWSQFSGGRSIDELINEDRGEY